MNDIIYSPEGMSYEIVDRLGHGTFGQVLKCTTKDERQMALKVIKNKPAYFQQGLIEVKILQLLNQSYDFRVVKMADYFVYRKHLCIVFELLSVNLYDVIKHNSFRGLPFNMVRSIVDQLTRALVCLKLSNVIHCDLKPENILLTTKKNTKIKLIDFGSASFLGQQVYTYIQSRFYRSVDVILGLVPFTPAIDMWSLGCIVAELFLGLPLFPGHSEFDQLNRIVELMGPIQSSILDRSKNGRKFFTKTPTGAWKLRSREEYEEVTGKKERVGRKHVSKAGSLQELIMTAPVKMSSETTEEELRVKRAKILSFIEFCLEYDPEKRLSPAQAVGHPLFDETVVSTTAVQSWKPRNDEACVRRLAEDANSFVHNSSSTSRTTLAAAGTNSSTLSTDMMSTPVKMPLLKDWSPLQPRNSQNSRFSRPPSSGIPPPDDSMPVSYRPALRESPKKWESSPTTVVRHRLPPGIPCSPNDLVVKWV